MIPVREVFVRAREILASEDQWQHGRDVDGHECCAVGPDGKKCGPTDPAACKWDLAGALWKAGAIGRGHDGDGPWIAISKVIDTEQIGNWNDAPERTHAGILAALDRAVAEAR